MNTNCVEDVYAGLRGFYKVALHSQEYCDQLLNRLPIFYGRSLVHVVPWRPLVEYQDILKQECPIWVEVECNQSTMWSLLYSTIAKLGKVVVPPNANVVNRYRVCILWNTKRKRSGCLHIEWACMPQLYFFSKWGIFGRHCFYCGNLGHLNGRVSSKGKQPGMPITEVNKGAPRNAECRTYICFRGGK